MSKLVVTPYIRTGKVDEARELSRVTDFPSPTVVESYSGFFNINEEFDSNLFFWFFPAARKSGKDAPLILWLPGGPGLSSLFGLFVGNGPFSIDEDDQVTLRSKSWTSMYSMLYLDPTVGAGYSHTNNQNGYAKTQEDVSNSVYEALNQFFTLFPKFQSMDFYIAGESYGGKFVTSLSWKIHYENINIPKILINLKGMIIGGGFIEPLRMLDNIGQYLRGMGLIDKTSMNYFNEKAADARRMVENGQSISAFDVQDELIGGDFYNQGTYYTKVTGYQLYLSVLHTTFEIEYITYKQFLMRESIAIALHAGNTPFNPDYLEVFKHFREEYVLSVKDKFEELLNLNYKTLMYVGQFDIIIPTFAQEDMLLSIDSTDFNIAQRKVWKIKGQIAGYVKQGKNLTFAIIRNAGHNPPFDKPIECLELITNFTKNVRY